MKHRSQGTSLVFELGALCLVFIFVCSNRFTSAQSIEVQERFALPNELSESSGVIFYNNRLVTHEDSGGEPELYELDTLTGEIARRVYVQNALNVDWEDLAQDDHFIFIGDIGNNSGSRTDLKVYKISKQDYLLSDTVQAQIIEFNYADQLDFSSQPNNTKWDAEALVSIDSNTLAIFTKDWVDGTSKAYRLPKSPGSFSITSDSTVLDAYGLITGATFVDSLQSLYLIGYTETLVPFVWLCTFSSVTDIFSGNKTLFPLSSLGFEQIESIDYVNNNRFLLTSESFNIASVSDYGKCIELTFQNPINALPKPLNSIQIYPNPFEDVLYIVSESMDFYELLNAFGCPVLSGNDQELNTSLMKPGVYHLNTVDKFGNVQTHRLIKVQ